jgi:hypothetical protein
VHHQFHVHGCERNISLSHTKFKFDLLAKDSPERAESTEREAVKVEHGDETLIVNSHALAHFAIHFWSPMLKQTLEHEHLTHAKSLMWLGYQGKHSILSLKKELLKNDRRNL